MTYHPPSSPVRREALDRALAHHRDFRDYGNGSNAETVIETAVKFEDYLLNGKKEAKSEQTDVKQATSEIPAAWQGDEDCWGVAWRNPPWTGWQIFKGDLDEYHAVEMFNAKAKGPESSNWALVHIRSAESAELVKVGERKEAAA